MIYHLHGYHAVVQLEVNLIFGPYTSTSACMIHYSVSVQHDVTAKAYRVAIRRQNLLLKADYSYNYYYLNVAETVMTP